MTPFSQAHFALTIIEENRDVFEQIICRQQITDFAATRSGETSSKANFLPTRISRAYIPPLSSAQVDYLRPQWQEFLKALVEAQQTLQGQAACSGLAMSCLASLSPSQGKTAAETTISRLAKVRFKYPTFSLKLNYFLLFAPQKTDIMHFSFFQAYLESMASMARLDDFLCKQSKAYFKLFIAFLEVSQ